MAPLVIFTLTILSHIAQVSGRAILENRDMNNASLQLNTTVVSNAAQVDNIKDNGTDADAPVWIIGLILLFAAIVIGFAVLFCRCLCCGVCCGLVFWDRSRYKTVKAEATVLEVVNLDATEADNRAFVNFKICGGDALLCSGLTRTLNGRLLIPRRSNRNMQAPLRLNA